jgi:hypothetical protein
MRALHSNCLRLKAEFGGQFSNLGSVVISHQEVARQTFRHAEQTTVVYLRISVQSPGGNRVRWIDEVGNLRTVGPIVHVLQTIALDESYAVPNLRDVQYPSCQRVGIPAGTDAPPVLSLPQ